ncbi:MAG: hypothetical protein GOU99_00655 [Candidatus Altiarchaeota archaeon]|nr:hypothetical protein [Candidatus Altiarchaeota archaeon]
MEKIVFDTCFLMLPGQRKLDIFKQIREKLGQFETIVPSPVMAELEFLASSDTNARIGLQILEQKEFQMIASEMNADSSVVQIAIKLKARVASTDQLVRKKARLAGLKLVSLRQGNYIILE